MEIHLITEITQCLPYLPCRACIHRTCLTYLNLTQLLFLADHDIVYFVIIVELLC